MSISLRLREERERLNLSQAKLAAIGGVQKRAQIHYEAGERHPDAAYLRGVAQTGVDVQYVLVGVRSANLQDVMLSDEFAEETFREQRVGAGDLSPTLELLSEEERMLLAVFRRAPADRRRAAVGAFVGALMAGSERSEDPGRESLVGAAQQDLRGANIQGGVAARDIINKGARRKGK